MPTIHERVAEGRVRLRAAGYYAHCTALDECFGDLWQTCKDAGVEENTVIVFSADHGDLLGSHGAYNKQQPFEESIRECGEGVPVRLFHWSSENHHLGRADAAVRLIDEIAALELPRRKRILVWGHSHAGNVFALMSNLLAGDSESIERFFTATCWPATPNRSSDSSLPHEFTIAYR